MSCPTGTTVPGCRARIASKARWRRPPSGIDRSASTTSKGPRNRISTRASCRDKWPAARHCQAEVSDVQAACAITAGMNPARLALVATFVVVAAAVSTLSAWGTAPGTNGDLVFRRYFDDSHTWGAIFTTTAGGMRVRQLTHPPKGVLDTVPDWSPDRRHIAFQRVDPNGCGPRCETDDIWVVTRDGNDLTRLAYDPDGKG